MKRSVLLAPVILLGVFLLLQTGCAVDDGGYYRYPYDRYDWYPYGSYYWWPYRAYPDRDYRYRYVPRHRDYDRDHYMGRPRPPHGGEHYRPLTPRKGYRQPLNRPIRPQDRR